MSKKTKRDKWSLGYRPESYWSEVDSPPVNVKGAHRKRAIARAMEEGTLDELPPELLGEKLHGELLAAAGKFDPRLMGGEYLPDYEGGEVEIARICLDSTTADVISVRACPGGEGILYRVTDEYNTDFIVDPETSRRSLTTLEMIELIDSSQHPELGPGLTSAYRDYNHDHGAEAEGLRHFVRVESDFYPALYSWYEVEAEDWVKSKKSER